MLQIIFAQFIQEDPMVLFNLLVGSRQKIATKQSSFPIRFYILNSVSHKIYAVFLEINMKYENSL